MKDFIAKMVVAISKNPEVPLHEAEAEAAMNGRKMNYFEIWTLTPISSDVLLWSVNQDYLSNLLLGYKRRWKALLNKTFEFWCEKKKETFQFTTMYLWYRKMFKAGHVGMSNHMMIAVQVVGASFSSVPTIFSFSNRGLSENLVCKSVKSGLFAGNGWNDVASNHTISSGKASLTKICSQFFLAFVVVVFVVGISLFLVLVIVALCLVLLFTPWWE